jgi:hypothetical protein
MSFAQGVGRLFNWNFNSNPDCSDLGLSLLQWSYDKDGYPTHTPLDDYRNERWHFFSSVRITRILRFWQKLKHTCSAQSSLFGSVTKISFLMAASEIFSSMVSWCIV